mgnify:CR=1 FL=1
MNEAQVELQMPERLPKRLAHRGYDQKRKMGRFLQELWFLMTSNQELLEMLQALEQKVIEQQRKIASLENDLDDAENRSNRLIQKMVTTTMFNNSMEIQKRYGLNDIRGRL